MERCPVAFRYPRELSEASVLVATALHRPPDPSHNFGRRDAKAVARKLKRSDRYGRQQYAPNRELIGYTDSTMPILPLPHPGTDVDLA